MSSVQHPDDPLDQLLLSTDDNGDGGVHLSLVPSHRNTVDDETIRLAVDLVKKSRVVGRLLGWKEEERKGSGGRPEQFPLEALLVGLMLCALTSQPLHLTRVCEILYRQLSPAWRERLGVPDPPADGDEARWKAAYRTVRTRFHTMLDLVDPSPNPKNRRLDDETFQRRFAVQKSKRTDEEWAERRDRLEWVINQLIEASINLLPRDVRRRWKGSIGVDGTLVKSHSRPFKRRRGTRATRGKKANIAVHSADPDAGYYIRPADSRDQDADSVGRDKIDWGYDATFGVSGSEDPDKEQDFPNLIVGMSVLCKPGESPGKQGARVLASLAARGHEAGLLAADRAFSSAKAEDFQLPALALGYRMAFDYKKVQLGVQAEYGGFLQIEGAWYSPSIPEALISATVDYRNHRIDEDTYKSLLKERWNYQPVPKVGPTPRATCASNVRQRGPGRWCDAH